MATSPHATYDAQKNIRHINQKIQDLSEKNVDVDVSIEEGNP